MILVCFLRRTIRSFFVLSDDLKEQHVLKEHCWKSEEVALTSNYVCIMIYMLIVSYYFPGKIDCFTLYIKMLLI